MGASCQRGPKLVLPFSLGSLPARLCHSRGHLEPGARLKRASSLATSVMNSTLIWPLLFSKKGTFGGQFHSKLCCLCSSLCWLAMKHQAAKHSRHIACQAAFQGNAWAASAPIPRRGAEFLHPRTGQCPHAHRGERLYLCERWGANRWDPQPLRKGQKWPVKQPRRWTAIANCPPQANVSAPARPPLHIGYFVY